MFLDHEAKVDNIVDTFSCQNFLQQDFNKNLVRTRKDVLYQKTYYFKATQGVSSGGLVSDVQTLRKMRINIPLHQKTTYEDRLNSSGEVGDVKSGQVFAVILCLGDDPSSTSNAGGISFTYNWSTVFQERA